MDAKELRIGNLVEYNGEIFPVIALSKDDIVIDGFGGLPNNFNAISLTVEWFPKVDFELHNDYVYPKGDNKYNFCLKKIDGKYYYVTSHYNGSFEIKSTAIEYFHRLQNIWFDTTGQELEFKL